MLEREGNSIRVDSRPSDAIAIALRLEAPIFAAESLLMIPEDEDESESESFQTPPGVQAQDTSELSAEQLKLYLEQLRPEDFGKFNL